MDAKARLTVSDLMILTGHMSTLIKIGLVEANPMTTIAEIETTDYWICFHFGGKEFGIWRCTGGLYEADEQGAMGEDPVRTNMTYYKGDL